MKKLWLILVLALLAGCVFRQSGASMDGLNSAHGEDARALAREAADVLSKREAPAHIALNLQVSPGPFSEAFETELRARGYALKENGLEVSYTADVLGDQAFVQVSCADGQRFSLARKLWQNEATITEPPNARPVRDEHSLEVRDLPEATPQKQEQAAPAARPAPELAAPPANAAVNSREESAPLPASQPVRTARVRARATAKDVAQRNHLPVKEFCAWNNVGPSAVLDKGYEVYLAEPPAGSIPTAAPVPIPAGVAALEAKDAASLSAPESQPLQQALAAAAGEAAASAPEQPAAPSIAPVQTAQPKPEQTSPRLHLENPQASAAPHAEPRPTALAVPPQSPSSPAVAVAETVSTASAVSQDPVQETVFVTPEPLTQPTWEIVQGRMLRDQLGDWATQAGFSLVWNARNDYELQSSATFRGDFVAAIREFFAALASNGLALRVTIYQGNNVMEVSEN